MAIIQYTGIVNQIRGKLNGSVFNKSKNSYTLQRAQAPAKNATPLQVERRRVFGRVQRLYKELSQAEKDIAQQTADNNPVFDRLGNLVHLSGYNQWVKANVLRVHSDLDILNELTPAPAPAFAVEVIGLQFAFSRFANGDLRYDFFLQSTILTGNQSDILWSLEVSFPQSRGVQATPSRFVNLGSATIFTRYTVGQPFNLSGQGPFRTPYPMPAPDTNVFVRFRFYDPDNGAQIFEILRLIESVVPSP